MILYTRWPGQREIVVQSPGADAHVLFTGERAIYTPTGFLIATDVATMPTALFARTFDVDTLDVGAPVLVAQNVALRNNKAQFAIGSGGGLAYVYGEPVSGTPIDLRLTHVARDGSRRALAAPPRPYRNPRVSPDGTRVAVEIVGDDTKSSVWVFDLAGDADIRRLTQVTEGNNLRPIWTPDGEHITFMSDRDGPGSIYSQDADGRGPAEKLTTAEPGIFHLPESWAPDGTLSFAVVHGGFGAQSWGLYTRNPDGETALFYDLPTSNQWSSAFSPDGRWIAYASGEDSNLVYDFRIFVERYPRTGERYEVASGGAVTPVWSRDGTEIFYRRGFQESARTMNVVRVLESERRFRSTTANSIQIEGFLNFPNYRDFDPLPDGSGWIMLTAVDPPGQDDAPAASDRIVVVLNWFEELERRLPKAN
jgi:hypothetical protein